MRGSAQVNLPLIRRFDPRVPSPLDVRCSVITSKHQPPGSCSEPAAALAVAADAGRLPQAQSSSDQANDQAMCVEPDFPTHRDQTLCGDHDAGAVFVQLGAHWLIAMRRKVRLRAQRLIHTCMFSITQSCLTRGGLLPLKLGGRTIYLDVAHEAEQVNVELDRAKYQFGPVHRERDMRRDAALAQRGWLTVRL